MSREIDRNSGEGGGQEQDGPAHRRPGGARRGPPRRPIAQQRYGEWRDRRVYRDRALKLARQIGGQLSEDTIIAGEPHFVVWKDAQPVQAFPPVEDLAARPELVGFDPQYAREPRPPRGRPRLPGRSR